MAAPNFDELSGRDLDLAVARHVFGHQVEELRNSKTGEMDAVYNVGRDANAPSRVRVPYYSGNLSASIRVDVEVQKQGWKWQERRTGAHWNEPSGVRVVLEHADGRTVEATGHPDEAICRAALKAVQYF